MEDLDPKPSFSFTLVPNDFLPLPSTMFFLINYKGLDNILELGLEDLLELELEDLEAQLPLLLLPKSLKGKCYFDKCQ